MDKKLKIKDIAKLAGVAPSTVSKVLNGTGSISEDVTKQILKLVEENNYIPSNAARALKGKSNKLIGVFLFDDSYFYKSLYFETLVSLAIDEIEHNSYSTLVSIINNDAKKKKMLDFFRNGTIDGGIIIGASTEEPSINELISKHYKLALINNRSSVDGLSNIIAVNSNNFLGGYLAGKYLIDSGRKKLLHISGNINKLSGKERLEGFKKSISDKSGIESMIYAGDFKAARIERNIEIFLEQVYENIDGIFAASDELAFCTVNALNNLNVKIPEKISVIGFDNYEIYQNYVAQITTISVDMKMIAKEAVNYLIASIESEIPLSSTVINTNLILIKRET